MTEFAVEAPQAQVARAALTSEVRALHSVDVETERNWRGHRAPSHIVLGSADSMLGALKSTKGLKLTSAFQTADGSALIPPKREGEPGVTILPRVQAMALDLDQYEAEQMRAAGMVVVRKVRMLCWSSAGIVLLVRRGLSARRILEDSELRTVGEA